MKTINGNIFTMRRAEEVLDFFQSRNTQKIEVSPKNISIKDDGMFTIILKTETFNEYPVRTSFIHKILKWVSLPIDLEEKISNELFVSLVNEIIHNLKSWKVDIHLENGEAKTITSKKYAELSNLEIFDSIRKMNITKISHNDFITRFYTEKKAETAPIENDYCGFGFDIINSETGFAALSLNHYILRYVCKNGATVPIQTYNWKQEHYNINKESLLDYIEKQIEYSSISRNNLITLMKKSSNEKAVLLKNSISAKLNYLIDPKRKNSIINSFNWNGSKYDLFNHITHNAKLFDVTKRYQLEKFAGEIIMN